MDVSHDQLEKYKRHVLGAVKASKQPKRLAVFLNRSSAAHGDVSKKVWEDYYAHVKDKKENGLRLDEFMRTEYAGKPVQIIFNQKNATAAAVLDQLLGDPAVGLAFTAAKTPSFTYRDQMDVAMLGAEHMADAFESQAKGAPRETDSRPYVPLAVSLPELGRGSDDLVKQELVKLYHRLQKETAPETIQKLLNERWGVAQGFFANKKGAYVPPTTDPRTVPADLASAAVGEMYALYKKAFYGADGRRITNPDEALAVLKNMSDEDLTTLERYERWMRGALKREIESHGLQVKKLSSDRQVIDEANRRKTTPSRPPPPPPREDDYAELEDEFSEMRLTPVLLAKARSKIMGRFRKTGVKHTSAFLAPTSASLIDYPVSSNPDHVAHIHLLAATSGWGPDVLTSRERDIYDATKNAPLPLAAEPEDYALAALSRAAFKRMNLKVGDTVDKDELFEQAASVVEMNPTADKQAELLYDARAAHFKLAGKPLLDLNGPVWTIMHMRDGAQRGWKSSTPGNIAAAVRGLSFLLNANARSANPEPSHDVLSRVFNTTSYMEPMEELVRHSAERVAMAPAFPLHRAELEQMCLLSGVNYPIDYYYYMPSDDEECGNDVYTSDEDCSGHESDSDVSSEEDEPEDFDVYDTYRKTTPALVAPPAAAAPVPVVQPTPAPAVPVVAPAAPVVAASGAPVALSMTLKLKDTSAPLSLLVPKGLLGESRTDENNTKVVVDLRKLKGCVVFKPGKTTSPAHRWVEDAHVMPASGAALKRFVQNSVVTMRDNSSHRLDSLVTDPAARSDVFAKIRAMREDSAPLVVAIAMPLKETSARG